MTTPHVSGLFKNLLLLVTGLKRRYHSQVNEGMKAGTHVYVSSQGEKSQGARKGHLLSLGVLSCSGEAVSFIILASPFSSSPATVPKGRKHRWQIMVRKAEAITFNEVGFFVSFSSFLLG